MLLRLTKEQVEKVELDCKRTIEDLKHSFDDPSTRAKSIAQQILDKIQEVRSY